MLAVRRVKCPCCGEELVVPITTELLEEASRSPTGVAAVVLSHGKERVVVYVDGDGEVQGASCAGTEREAVIEEIREVPVPSGKKPDPRKLSEEEWRFLALCDGKRSLREIAGLLGITYQEARLLAEKMRSRGYLREVVLEV